MLRWSEVSLRMKDDTSQNRIEVGEGKKASRFSLGTYYVPRPTTRRTSISLDLGPTPRTLLFSHRPFFSYVDTRWPC